MAISHILTTLLCFIAISLAYPVYDNPYQLEQWRKSVELYVDTYPPALLEEFKRTIASTTAPQACEDVFLIFARGTFEPAVTDNLGIMVGVPFTSALKIALAGRNFASIGVDYNNSVAGYLSGGDSAGGRTMAKMISDKARACPSTKIVASGYSQGAQVTHNALSLVGGDVKSHVAAVVVFGDPNKGKPIPGISNSKIYTNCAASDPICMGLPIPLGAHLQYGSDTAEMTKVTDFLKKIL